MIPVFVALTAGGVETAQRARAALGGEIHLRANLLPLWEKVPLSLRGGG